MSIQKKWVAEKKKNKINKEKKKKHNDKIQRFHQGTHKITILKI